MVEVFYCDSYKKGQSELLCRTAIKRFLSRKNLPAEPFEIVRKENEKPFFNGAAAVYFSVSHSQTDWICAVSDKNIGADIEVLRAYSYHRVAEKYYSDEEKSYTDLFGEEGFFRIWTMKESCVKLSGRGISGIAQTPCMIQKGEPVYKTDKVIFYPFQTSRKNIGCLCMENESTVIFTQITLTD